MFFNVESVVNRIFYINTIWIQTKKMDTRNSPRRIDKITEISKRYGADGETIIPHDETYQTKFMRHLLFTKSLQLHIFDIKILSFRKE